MLTFLSLSFISISKSGIEASAPKLFSCLDLLREKFAVLLEIVGGLEAGVTESSKSNVAHTRLGSG